MIEGKDFYFEGPYKVFTKDYLISIRKFCCKNSCRHCPWNYEIKNKSKMKSSFVKWLEKQVIRDDEIGNFSKWIFLHDFEPIEFSDILDKINTSKLTEKELNIYREVAINSLLEFSLSIDPSKIAIMKETDVQKERLNRAVKNENYEQAAIIRDAIKKSDNEI